MILSDKINLFPFFFIQPVIDIFIYFEGEQFFKIALRGTIRCTVNQICVLHIFKNINSVHRVAQFLICV